MSHSPRHDDPLQAIKDITGDSSARIVIAGAILSVLTSFIPFSPLLGGALAGWLVRDDSARGATLGGISGLLITLPFGVIFVPVFGFAFLDVGAGGFFFLLVALVFAFFGLLYTAGVGALGGYLGVRLYESRVGNAAGSAGPGRPGSGRHGAGYTDARRRNDESAGWSNDRDDAWSDDRGRDDESGDTVGRDDRDRDRDTRF